MVLNALDIGIRTVYPNEPDGQIIISIVASNPGADYTFIPVSDIVTMTNYYPLFFYVFRTRHKNKKKKCMQL